MYTPMPESPHLPATPAEAVGPITKEAVLVDKRVFHFCRPAESHHLLDDPYVREAFSKDEFMPYWTDIWPASRMLAKVLHRSEWPPGLLALEIGCGLGLPGVVALAKGMEVIFSDYDATALRFAADNAKLNGFDRFRTLQMDWRFPPDDLQVPLILAADLIYELRNIEPLVLLIKKMLLPDGFCLLADPDRLPASLMREALAEARLVWTTKMVRAGEPGGKRIKGTVYRICKRSE